MRINLFRHINGFAIRGFAGAAALGFAAAFFAILFSAGLSAPAGAVPGCTSCTDYTPGAIVLPVKTASDPAMLFAARELASAMKELYATAPEIVSDADYALKNGSTDGVVVVGRDNALLGNPDIAALLPEFSGAGSDEAFRAAAGDAADRPMLLVQGGGERGDVYGLIYVAERLRLDPHSITKISIYRKPAFAIRIASGETPEQALRLGYNTLIAKTDYNKTVELDGYMTLAPDQLTGVRDRRKDLRDEISADKNLQLDTISVSDEFEYNRALLDFSIAGKISNPKNREWLCTCHDDTWRLYSDKYKEIIGAYPGLDYVMVRIGENYSSGDYFGNMPAGKDMWNDCDRCVGRPYADRVANLINRTWLEVAGGGGKKYIQRTWDTNSDTFHSNPYVYKQILDKVNNKSGLYLSVKYTQTDFWRYNFSDETRGMNGEKPVARKCGFEYYRGEGGEQVATRVGNRTIGVGDVPQIVEHQCTREYEGKGAFPNFIGEELSRAYLNEAACGPTDAGFPGVVGVWNWHHGGGWNGPFPKDDMWNQVNIYVAAHLAWDPTIPAAQLARDWAVLNFGQENADQMVRLLLISDDAVLKLVYIRAYALKKKSPWMPNENWTRDDEIKGGDALRPVYEAVRDDVAMVVAEKNDGVHVIEQMQGLASTLSIPAERKQFIVDSLQYELLWGKVLRDYIGAYLYYCQWKDTGRKSARELVLLYSSQWQADWNSYNDEMKNLRYAATPYHDTGMSKTVLNIIAEIAEAH